jgi:hypothetical protein
LKVLVAQGFQNDPGLDAGCAESAAGEIRRHFTSGRPLDEIDGFKPLALRAVLVDKLIGDVVQVVANDLRLRADP